jgi:hypothetical protein
MFRFVSHRDSVASVRKNSRRVLLRKVMDGFCEHQTEHIKTIFEKAMVSDFCREVDENCIARQENTVFNFFIAKRYYSLDKIVISISDTVPKKTVNKLPLIFNMYVCRHAHTLSFILDHIKIPLGRPLC